MNKEYSVIVKPPRLRRLVATTYVLLLGLVAWASAAPAANPPPVQTFYVPFPEDQVQTALETINSAATDNPVDTYVSIAAIANETIVYYDHWEDGYEADIASPTQTTTEIWGDGDAANGSAPGLTGDLIDAGAVIVLEENDIDVTTLQAVVDFDGRDKFGVSKTVAVTRAAWAAPPGTVLAGSLEVYDTNNWGTSYEAPAGENLSSSGANDQNDMFQYTGLIIQAAKDGTVVDIDADANGVAETTVTLNEGESHQVNDGVNVGATVGASEPVQVDLITGDIGASYESRWFTLLPTNQWDNSYYTPVGTNSGDPSYVWVYNPDTSAITVQWATTGGTQTSFSVPAGQTLRRTIPNNSGAHFFSVDGPFSALTTIDSDASGNLTHDWGMTLLPEDRLTSQILIGLGLGKDPTSGGSENSAPVWVTPVGNGNTAVDIYVDYNGDGVGSLTDPNGFQYDQLLSLNELQSERVYDSDGDQTGMLLYVLDTDVKLAAAWGQDPNTASGGSPAIDVGTGIPPLPEIVAGKNGSVEIDADQNGSASPGDTLLYTIVIQNITRVPAPDVIALQDWLPVDTTYVLQSTFLDDGSSPEPVPIADNQIGTEFPLDEGGIDLGTLAAGGEYRVTFQVLIKDFEDLTPPSTSILNLALVTVGAEEIPVEDETPLDFGPAISIEKTVYAGHDAGVSCPGNEEQSGGNGAAVTYCFEVTNEGGTYLYSVSIDDLDLGITEANMTPPSGNVLLAPDESLVYYYETTISGNLINTAEASANPTYANGDDLPSEDDVSASDTAEVEEIVVGSLSGHLYLDTNGNGSQDAGEPDLANVDVIVTDSAGNVQTVSTDANGDWSATGLAPGGATANVDETDADYPAGTTQTQGDDPTATTVVAGQDTDGGTDGYQPPTGTVSGHVYEDSNGNGTQDAGEPNLGGVDVLITDSAGNQQTVTTDADGNYSAEVPAGETVIDIVDTTLPANIGQTEGTDTTTVTVPSGGNASDIDGYEPALPGIEIEKRVKVPDSDPYEFTDDTLTFEPGTEVTFDYEVRNTGNVPLSGVKVGDDNATPTDSGDDAAFTVGSSDASGGYVSGDDGNGLLDLDEVWRFEFKLEASFLGEFAGTGKLPVATSEMDKYLLIGTTSNEIAKAVNVQNGDLGADVVVLSTEINDNVDFDLQDVFVFNAGALWVDVDDDPNTQPDYLPGAAQVGEGVTWTGDVALTSPKAKFDFSNVELYGQVGVVADSRRPQSSVSNSRFFAVGMGNGIDASGGKKMPRKGVFKNADPQMAALRSELDLFEDFVVELAPEVTLRPGNGLPTSEGIEDVDVFTLTIDPDDDSNGDDIVVYDIDVGDKDFKITNSNWIIDGDGTKFAIFRILGDSNLVLNQATVLLGEGGIAVDGELGAIFVKASGFSDGSGGYRQGEDNSGDTVFSFNDTVLNGVGFYDLIVFDESIGNSKFHNGTTELKINNGQGCSHFVSPKINFNDVRFDHCAFGRLEAQTNIADVTATSVVGDVLANDSATIEVYELVPDITRN